MTMAKRKGRRVPQRTCVGCLRVRPKREMVRLVRTPADGVQVDETGKRAGRGAYLCPERRCWETAFEKRRLEHALKTGLSEEERISLRAFAESLPTHARQGEEVSGGTSAESDADR